MTAARSVTATFTVMEHLLTIFVPFVFGGGSGTVTSSPVGINCGTDCSESYAFGTVVTLTALPAVGSTFAGWSGAGCSGIGSCQVTMTAARSVTATFTVMEHLLTIFVPFVFGGGSGTVTSSPVGINCGTDCSESYAFGTVVTLTALPAVGSRFVGWTGGRGGGVPEPGPAR